MFVKVSSLGFIFYSVWKQRQRADICECACDLKLWCNEGRAEWWDWSRHWHTNYCFHLHEPSNSHAVAAFYAFCLINFHWLSCPVHLYESLLELYPSLSHCVSTTSEWRGFVFLSRCFVSVWFISCMYVIFSAGIFGLFVTTWRLLLQSNNSGCSEGWHGTLTLSSTLMLLSWLQLSWLAKSWLQKRCVCEILMEFYEHEKNIYIYTVGPSLWSG